MGTRIENTKEALGTCDPERRWKADKLIPGRVVVGNGHFFAVLSHEEHKELGCELLDVSASNEKLLADWIAFDSVNGAEVVRIGKFGDEFFDAAHVYKFAMGWMFPVRSVLAELLAGQKLTTTAVGEGFLVIAKGEDGQVLSGAMSLANYSQKDMGRLCEAFAKGGQS
jgi:hypothetical protein